MKNFVASGVDAIIVNIVDTSAGAAVSAAAGNVPLVYVNREPDNVNDLPATQAFVASNEIESGTLSAFEVCKNLRAEGKGNKARGYLMNGQLTNQAAVQREVVTAHEDGRSNRPCAATQKQQKWTPTPPPSTGRNAHFPLACCAASAAWF